MNHELIRIVGEDLIYLKEEWNQDISDASLRRASPTMRNLLIEGNLLKVANLLNEQITVLAPEISRFESQLDDPYISFYQCGGAKYKGVTVQSMKMYSRALSGKEIKEDYERDKNSMDRSYAVKLSKFLKQCSFVIEGVKINREEVIKYLANKRGGAHYDPSRDIDKKGSKGELEQKYKLLDKVHDGMISCDKNAVYFELLSIGQRLVNSPDVQRICEIIIR